MPQISVGAACPRRRGGGKAGARGGNDHVHGGGDGWMDGWMRVMEKGIKESTAQTGEFFVSHRSV